MTTIAELVEDRTVEGVYAVARKDRRRTRNGASYLSLELVDASGRIDARVWDDVELLDGRFSQGDAVRVLGRVERFGGRLQVQVRSLEAAPEADPAELTPTLRRDADELEGFLEFLAAEITHPGLAGVVGRSSATPSCGPPSARFPRQARTGTTATPAACSSTRSASPHCAARRHSSIRVCERICCWLPRCCTTSAERGSWSAGRRSARPRRAACSVTCTSGCA